MTERKKPIGILGGTFDPIHFGHLRIAQEVYEFLRLDHVRFIPCWLPPHKSKTFAHADHRLELLNTAVNDNAAFCVDNREYQRQGPSYSIDTLQSLRVEFPNTPLCLIMGSDSFLHLDTWRSWQQLIEFCHLIIAVRPGWEGNPEKLYSGFFSERLTENRNVIQNELAGQVFIQQVTQLDISATRIRQAIQDGESPRYLLPDGVINLINEKQLYRDEG